MTGIPAPTTPAPAGSHYDTYEPHTPADLLNRAHPAAAQTRLGDTLVDIVTQVNHIVADVAALRTKYQALLAGLDAYSGAPLGTANVATYGDAAETAVAIQQLGAR